MRRVVVIAAFLAFAGVVFAQAESRASDYFRRFGRQMVTEVEALFEFLPSSGMGAPQAADLCDAVQSGDQSGNWWCLKGDGTMAVGSQLTLSAVGAPVTQTRPLCSNGLNCADATAQRTDGVDDGYEPAANHASTSGGDFSLCWLGSHDSWANYREIISHDSSGGTSRAFGLYSDVTGAAQFIVYKTDASSTTVTSAGGMAARAWHLVCASYDFVTDGTSVMRLYVDGAASGSPSTTAVGPVQTASGTRVGVHERQYPGFRGWLPGAFRGAMFTEKVLSAADISRLSTAVHGTLTGSKAETITFTRASTQFCENGAGAGTTLPSGRPCVAQGGYLSEGAATNISLRSEELTHAMWTAFSEGGGSAPTITANYGTAPDGTLTAERLQTVAAGTASSTNGKGFDTTSGSTYTMSVYVKGSSTSGTIYVGDWNAASGNKCTKTACAFTSAGFTRCTHTFTADETKTGEHRPWVGFLDGRGCSSTGGVAAVDVLAWGHQNETGSFATSYIRTEGSTAARVASTATVARPSGFSASEGCARFDFKPEWDTPSTLFGFLSVNSADNALLAYTHSNSTAGSIRFLGSGGVTESPADEFVAGTTRTYRTTWSTLSNYTSVNNVTSSSSATSTHAGMGTLGANLYLGDRGTGSGANAAWGWIGAVEIDRSRSACGGFP